MNQTVPALEWLDDLNPAQRAAVTYGEGPLLVVAGAGSGKTKTLAYRVAYLIATGIDPSRILLLTFTRRAAAEMLRRAESVVRRGAAATERVWGGTFHATANRLLRVHAAAVGLSPDFTIMDQGDAEDLMNVVRHDMGLSGKQKRFPRKSTCLAVYSRCVNGDDELKTVLQEYFPWCLEWMDELKALFKRYVERKQARSVLDYDDLLLYWELLVSTDGAARSVGGRFDHVLVDEYQDTNPVQARILRGMRRFGRNIMVVGDDAQSIYSFRGATVRNMLDFPKQFPGTTIVTLEQNYRSVTPILEATNRLIAASREAYAKNLWSSRKSAQKPVLVTCRDEAQQDEFVAGQVLAHYEEGIALRRQAVLFRASHHSDSLEVELTKRDIPYRKYGGLRFLEAAHVKDMVAFLRILENPRDEIPWFRVLQLLEGMGPASAVRAFDHVRGKGFDPRALASFEAPGAAKEGVRGLAALMDDLANAKAPPAVEMERIGKFYRPYLETIYENPIPRARDLENLERIASGYRSRQSFLTDLALDPPNSTEDFAGAPVKDEDWLVLSTIHSAKGCEWDAVYLIHASDGCLPSDMATGRTDEIEEERRLAYVAMTRARDFLYVSWPLRYYHTWSRTGDRHDYVQRSRFLGDDVVACFEERPLAQETADEDRYLDEPRDYRARLRSRWD